MKRDNPEHELTAIEAARVLSVDLNYLYMQLRLGRIAGRKVADQWRIPESAVLARRKRQEDDDNGEPR
jgi:excisionase family DNA binding protein